MPIYLHVEFHIKACKLSKISVLFVILMCCSCCLCCVRISLSDFHPIEILKMLNNSPSQDL